MVELEGLEPSAFPIPSGRSIDYANIIYLKSSSGMQEIFMPLTVILAAWLAPMC